MSFLSSSLSSKFGFLNNWSPFSLRKSHDGWQKPPLPPVRKPYCPCRYALNAFCGLSLIEFDNKCKTSKGNQSLGSVSMLPTVLPPNLNHMVKCLGEYKCEIFYRQLSTGKMCGQGCSFSIRFCLLVYRQRTENNFSIYEEDFSMILKSQFHIRLCLFLTILCVLKTV